MKAAPPLVFILLPIAIFLAFRWHFARSSAILQRWADENGYEILEKSYRHFFKGPFFWRTSKNQTVYRVTVRDKAGDVGTGWVACGSFWWGLWSNQAKVRWDEPPQPVGSAMHDRWLDG